MQGDIVVLAVYRTSLSIADFGTGMAGCFKRLALKTRSENTHVRQFLTLRSDGLRVDGHKAYGGLFAAFQEDERDPPHEGYEVR